MKKYLFYIVLIFIMMFSFNNVLAKNGESICNYIQVHGKKGYKSYIRVILYDDGSVELKQGDEAAYNAVDSLNLGIGNFAGSIKNEMQNGKCFKYIAIENEILYINNEMDIKSRQYVYQNLDINGFESAKTITCKYPIPAITNIDDENTITYNPIKNTCSMKVYVYGDMGALMETYKECSKDVLSWIRDKRACVEGFKYDPNNDFYDLDDTNDGISYEGREEYKEELEKREKDNEGRIENQCEGLLGDNTLKLLKKFRNGIMIAGPIIALVLGTYDLIVAMANGEEEAKKKGMKKMRNRLIAAALLLLIPYILDLLLNIVNTAGRSCV